MFFGAFFRWTFNFMLKPVFLNLEKSPEQDDAVFMPATYLHCFCEANYWISNAVDLDNYDGLQCL